jgi:hypothetical protein
MPGTSENFRPADPPPFKWTGPREAAARLLAEGTGLDAAEVRWVMNRIGKG